MTSTQKNERLDMIKNIAKKQKIASDEAKSFKATIQKLDERKKILGGIRRLNRSRDHHLTCLIVEMKETTEWIRWC